MRTKSFAQKLCVSAKGDVDRIKNATLEDGQKGLLFNLSNHKVLYAKGIYDRVYPASITKILTTLLACENLNAKTNITVSENASTSVTAGDSSIYAAPGEKFTRDQALMAVMLQSANEMSVAVAEKVSGSVKKFTELMNWRARLFGCKNTHFNNPNGLPDENHYTTASDMAKIAKSAWMNPLYRKFCTRRYYEIPPTNKFAEARQLLNHHKMIKNGEYYFLGWMENAEDYKYVIAKHPEENLLDRDCFSDANSHYCNIISCDGYNDAYLSAKNENPYSDFLSNIKCYERNAMSDADDHDIFSLTMDEIYSISDALRDGDYVFVIDDFR